MNNPIYPTYRFFYIKYPKPGNEQYFHVLNVYSFYPRKFTLGASSVMVQWCSAKSASHQFIILQMYFSQPIAPFYSQVSIQKTNDGTVKVCRV